MQARLITPTALELELLCPNLHDSILEALVAVLQTGVPVRYLLPPRLNHQLPSLSVWGTFVRLALGIDHDHQGRLASVKRIDLSAQFAGTPHFGSFCSALAFARGVDALGIYGAITIANTGDAFGSHRTSRDHVWRWLAFALVSRASQSSLKRLVVEGERLLLRDVSTIKAMVKSVSPVATLMDHIQMGSHVAVEQSSVFASELKSIIVPKWTVLRVCGPAEISVCHAPHDLLGQQAAMCGSSDDALVFLPGYGLCWIDHVERPTKRARLSVDQPHVGSCFESIVIFPESPMQSDTAALEQLVRVIGRRLRSLRFAIACPERTLRVVLELCPNLTWLAMDRAEMESLAPIEDAYTNGGAQLTSLRLDVVTLPEAAARAFLGRLADPSSAVGQTLERLQWDVSTIERGDHVFLCLNEFERVLAVNETLTHVTNGAHSLLDQLHGQRIPGRSRWEHRRLLAFLGSAHRLCVDGMALDALVRRHIWAFAEERRHRAVVGRD